MPVEKVDNFGRARRAIEDGLETGLQRAAEDELETIEDGFSQGRDALGRPWQELAPSTIRGKGHDRVLIDSGALSESGFVDTEMGGTVRFGLSSGLAPIHEYGTRTIPRRPILGPAMIDLQSGGMQETLVDTIESALRHYGFRS